jgi:hypothetical protein
VLTAALPLGAADPKHHGSANRTVRLVNRDRDQRDRIVLRAADESTLEIAT